MPRPEYEGVVLWLTNGDNRPLQLGMPLFESDDGRIFDRHDHKLVTSGGILGLGLALGSALGSGGREELG